jgi:hypothetical protein
MASIWIADKVTPANIINEKDARNWRQTPEGSDVRMSNLAAPLRALGEANNRVMGRHPKVHFHMPQPITDEDTTQADSTGADPLYRWLTSDYWANGRDYTVKFLVAPRTSGSGNAYAEYEGGAYSTPALNYTPATLQLCQHVREAQYTVNRGAATDSEQEEGISTYNGYTVLDVLVQDAELNTLDTTIHSHCTPATAKSTAPVVEGLIEDIRSTFHDARRYNMGQAFCWAAQGIAETPAAPGNATCMSVGSTTYVNVIDQGVTARDANSPGILVPAYLKGRGNITKAAGQTVRVDVRVLANSAAEGTVKFIGPNGSTEVTITAGGGLDWYSAGEHLDLSSNSNDLTDTATTRNKVDIHAKVASGVLYIYGIEAWYTYE